MSERKYPRSSINPSLEERPKYNNQIKKDIQVVTQDLQLSEQSEEVIKNTSKDSVDKKETLSLANLNREGLDID